MFLIRTWHFPGSGKGGMKLSFHTDQPPLRTFLRPGGTDLSPGGRRLQSTQSQGSALGPGASQPWALRDPSSSRPSPALPSLTLLVTSWSTFVPIAPLGGCWSVWHQASCFGSLGPSPSLKGRTAAGGRTQPASQHEKAPPSAWHRTCGK